MITLQDKINTDLIGAMRSRDKLRLSVLRQLKTHLANSALVNNGNISANVDDLGTIAIIRKLLQQREEALTSYIGANRPELAEQEQSEAAILKEYLPEGLSLDELTKLISQIIQKFGVVDIKGMGLVIREAIKEVNGRASSKEISEVTKKLLQ